ncbi:MAG: iron ABC transporter permease [Candidatus Lustribacter sp.]
MIIPEERAPRWALPSTAQLVVLLLIAAVGFFVVYPLALIFINSFNTAPPGHPAVYSTAAWAQAWHGPGLLSALLNTVAVGACYQAIAFPVGVLLAWLLGRTRIPHSRALEFGFWLSYFLPPLSATLGWILLLDPLGVLNNFIVGTFHVRGPFNVYSFAGIVWVHLMSRDISEKVILLTPAFRNMDAALEEAGYMSGAGRWRTLLRLTLPIMTPPLVIVFFLGFVRLFESFEIELLLGIPFGFYVFSTKIIDLAQQEPPLLGQATALGSVTLLLLLIAVPIQRWLTTRRTYTTVGGRMQPNLIDFGRWRWPVFSLLAGMVGLLVLVPLLSVIAGSLMTRFGFFNLAHPWTLANWQRTLSTPAFSQALVNTFEIAIVSAVVAPIVFSVIAYVLVRARSAWGSGVLDFLLWLPSVIPGALAGLGLLWMFVGTPVFQPIYGTIWVLVIAVILSGMTLSSQTLKGAFLQLRGDLEESARMSGAGWIRTYVQIVLPLIAPTLIVVAAIKFMFAANAASNIILLATSETRTLSLLALGFVADGQREAATVVTVVITAITTAMAILVRTLGLNVGIRSGGR